MSTPTIKLSQEQIDFFQREGYLSLPALTTAEEVIRLQATYDRLFVIKAGRAEGDHLDLVTTDEDDQESVLPQILNPSKYAPELIDTQLRVNAAAIVKQLLGDDAHFHSDHAIRKPAQSGVETPWHQDEAYWDADKEYNALSIWVPLQEATLENGCMQFVPASNQREVLPHHPIGNDPRIIGLEVDDPAEWAQSAVACPLPPAVPRFITAARCTLPEPTIPASHAAPTSWHLARQPKRAALPVTSTGKPCKRPNGTNALPQRRKSKQCR